MLTTCHQTKSKSGLIKYHIRSKEDQQCKKHEPAEFKFSNSYQECFLGHLVGNCGRNVVRIFCHVDGSYDNNSCSRSKKIQGRTNQCLVCIEMNGSHTKEQGKYHSHKYTGQNHQKDHNWCRSGIRKIFHHQGTAKCTHNHNSLKTNVDDTAVLGKTAAKCYENQYRSKY